MESRITRTVFTAFLLTLAALIALPANSYGQTFRGGINGTVTDSSGAVVPGAQVVATAIATNTIYKTVSSSAGEFAFANLPLGDYVVTIDASQFTSAKFTNLQVEAGKIYTLPVVLKIASQAQTVEVSADGLALDTTTDTQTTVLPEEVVQNLPNNGRDFTQMAAQTTGYAGYSIGGGAGVASINGTRSNSVNWQIEGTDNNDLWWNIPAVNQGGVSGIAGVILPVDAIQDFSLVTTSTPENGRNAGGTANLVIKSGTNMLHGTAYYFNRDEFFAASNPLTPIGQPKNKVRDQNYGFSVGGPIIRDRLFFFLSGEHQGFVIGNQTSSTEPSLAYQTQALTLLSQYGVPVNPVAQNLLANFWPQSALGGPASAPNYFNPGTENGHSFNGLGKIDFNATAKDHLSAKWFVGQGNQTAPTSSYLSPYYEIAPIHVQNISLVYNRVLTTAMTNQLSAGVSYFNQAFSDADNSFDPLAQGLNTGVTTTSLAGAPKIIIGPAAAGSGLSGGETGFDPIGVTVESGRNDITGHLDEDLAWTKGAHQFHFGGEFRQAQVDDFYWAGGRGQFNFNGSQGPWAPSNYAPQSGSLDSSPCAQLATQNQTQAPTITDANTQGLADFLAGCPSSATITEGDPKRQVFVNTFALYAQDSWQLNHKLTVDVGLRYDYSGPLHSQYNDLTSFDPTAPGGLAVIGVDRPDLFNKFWAGFSPRVGFAWQPEATAKTVIRGGFGMYYDAIYMIPFLNVRNTTNNGPVGVEDNPAGSQPVAVANAGPLVIQSGVPVFQPLNVILGSANTSLVNLFSVARDFEPSDTYSYNLNLQHSFGPAVVAQLGYVGTSSHHLTAVYDVNQAATNTNFTPDQTTRPYYSQFPNFAVINQVQSTARANYNSLQSSLRFQSWHGFSSQLAYTWSHALDMETGIIPYLPQNSFDPTGEWGNSDFDTRNTFTGYASYRIPDTSVGPRVLTNGWELNSGFSFHGGQPFSVVASTNTSGNGENADRADLMVANPFSGVSHAVIRSSSGANVQWFSPTAFQDPAAGQYGTTGRNQFYNPGYSDVDLSVFKNTKISERVNTQFRVEMYNLLNRTNLAPVGAPQTGEEGVIGSTIGSYFGAPGIGPGEPFNVQFALKVIF